MPFADMDEPGDYHIKWSKSDRGRQIIIRYLLYVESKKKKKDTNELIHKTKIDSHRKQIYRYQRGNVEEKGIN